MKSNIEKANSAVDRAINQAKELSELMDGCEYKGVVSSTKKQQKILNTMGMDMLLCIDAKPEFEKWFKENIQFGFGMGWLKGIAKKFCWYGYFAGYKRGLR